MNLKNITNSWPFTLEKFKITLEQIFLTVGQNNYVNKIPFLSIFSRQGSFFYQVSLDHYRDSEFLVDAFTRYRMYLFLKKQYKDKFLVPCYDMDLVWHTHQVSTLHYTKDMNGILGFVLKHDDSVNDR